MNSIRGTVEHGCISIPQSLILVGQRFYYMFEFEVPVDRPRNFIQMGVRAETQSPVRGPKPAAYVMAAWASTRCNGLIDAADKFYPSQWRNPQYSVHGAMPRPGLLLLELSRSGRRFHGDRFDKGPYPPSWIFSDQKAPVNNLQVVWHSSRTTKK